jgi:hypothetical protein
MHTSKTLSRTSPARTPHPGAAAALIVAAGMAQSAHGAWVQWDAGDGSWFTATNWNTGAVPTPANDVQIGNLSGISNSTVTFSNPGGTTAVQALELQGVMTLDITHGRLQADTFDNYSGHLIVRSEEGLRAELRSSSDITLMDDASLIVLGDSWSNGTIAGRGSVRIFSPDVFQNYGSIEPSNNGGLTLEASFMGLPMPIDLDADGIGVGVSRLWLETPFSVLRVNAHSLADPYSWYTRMAPGSLLEMNLATGWEADADARVTIMGLDTPAAASQIAGSDWTFGGELVMEEGQSHLRVLANAVINDTATGAFAPDSWVEFDGETTVEGGVFIMQEGARIDFDGPTHIEGGTFSMVGNSTIEGVVRFNSDTAWSGETTFKGVARQVGDATTTGGLGTVINATTFDMDGNGSTHWAVNNSVVVNADAIDLLGAQTFDGSMVVSGGVFGAMRINLTDPGAAWIMAGSLELAGSGALPVTRIAGSHMIVTGDLDAVSGIVQITADTTLAPGSQIDIADGATLRVRGNTIVESGAAFTGTGTLQNGLDGTMLLESGVGLAQIGLINNGALRIGEAGPGIAAVDTFASTAPASWNIDIGGYAAGTEHDILLVTGGASTLDGLLTVTLNDLGAGLFVPQIGDEFTILASVGGVSGVFSNAPVSLLPGGMVVEWSVIYNPSSVVLRVDTIVPAPGPVALAAAALALGVVRRRRA